MGRYVRSRAEELGVTVRGPVRAGAATLQVRPAGVGGGGPCEARPPRAVSIQAWVDRKPPWGMGGAAAGLPPHYSRVDEPAWSGTLAQVAHLLITHLVHPMTGEPW